MNSISFQGRKEVIYGLGKAASFAREAALNKAKMQGPKAVNTSAEYKSNLRLAEAYLDMVTYDDAFISTISEFPPKKINLFSSILEKNTNELGIESNPFPIFSSTIVKKYLSNNQRVNLKPLLEFLGSLK